MGPVGCFGNSAIFSRKKQVAKVHMNSSVRAGSSWPPCCQCEPLTPATSNQLLGLSRARALTVRVGSKAECVSDTSQMWQASTRLVQLIYVGDGANLLGVCVRPTHVTSTGGQVLAATRHSAQVIAAKDFMFLRPKQDARGHVETTPYWSSKPSPSWQGLHGPRLGKWPHNRRAQSRGRLRRKMRESQNLRKYAHNGLRLPL